MKVSILVFLFCAVLSSSSAFANFPRNNLHLQDRVGGPSNVTEEQFNKITDAIVAMWQPLAKLHGAQLVAVKNWNDATVNAYADQKGNQWMVSMYGGLARRPEITPDGFALVVCHELGHHFGGYYFYGPNHWAAGEGQADYFATDVCAKRVFAAFFDRRFLNRTDVPPYVKQRCDAVWKESAAAQSLCYRSASAGLSLATLLAAIGASPAPKFETPDPTRVPQTVVDHPRAQCRLDTYLAGAVCAAPFDLKVIPAKGLPGGQNSKEGEAVAAKVSCMEATQKIGFRPYCWFKPQLGFHSSLN